VVAPVPGQEGDPQSGDLTDRDRRRGRAERRVELDLLDPVEERVEPRSPVDPDVSAATVPPGRVHPAAASVFVDEAVEPESVELDDELSDDPDDPDDPLSEDDAAVDDVDDVDDDEPDDDRLSFL
jgi:hypothetical protein